MYNTNTPECYEVSATEEETDMHIYERNQSLLDLTINAL